MITFLTAGLITLTACGSGGSDDKAGAPSGGGSASPAAGTCDDAPSTVTIALPSSEYGLYPTNDLARFYGYMDAVQKDCNTTVKYQVFSRGSDGFAAMLAQQVQFLIVSTDNVFSAAAQGRNVVQVFQATAGPSALAIAPMKYKSRGTGLAGLKEYDGDNWGVTSSSGQAAAVANAAASAAGLGAQKLTAIGNGPAAEAAVKSDKVSVAFEDLDTSARLLADGTAYQVLNPSGAELHDAVLGDFALGQGLISTTDFTKAHPKFVTALVGAQLQGLRKAQELATKPQEVFGKFPAAYQQGSSNDIFNILWSEYALEMKNADGYASKSEIAGTLSFSQNKSKSVPANATIPDQTFDNSFVVAAYKKLGLTVPTG